MRGARRSFALLTSFVLPWLLACGGDRGAGAPAGDSIQTLPSSDTASPDTGTTARPDSSTGSAARTDSAPPPAKAVQVARATPPKKTAASTRPSPPAAKPAAPAPAASDTPPAAPSAPTTETAPAQTQASAPLRDEYHRAPLDTVSQQVYDGWKQYNLNCARCHGEDVLGTTIAPHLIVSLKPNGPIRTKELFVQTVCAGRPEKGMPAWCPLGMEMDKIQAIYAYVKGRSDGEVRPGRPALKPEG